MDEDFVKRLSELSEKSSMINQELYDKYNVKRGLRNKDHTGVLVGLTHIGDVIGYKVVDGEIIPAEGDLLYRGVSIKNLVEGFQKDGRPGFEETIFLLLFGKLPAKNELEKFSTMLSELRDLPENFTEDMILKLKGRDIMNMLARCVLVLYTLDRNADDISTLNILKQSIGLIARFPTLIAYAYQARRYHYNHMNLSIRHPENGLTTAANLLYMVKGHKRYTKLEAELLDLVLVLHAEHGGGNNSTFATRVVSSSDTDTYSAIAAALGSLKGPLHGGANLRVTQMMEDIKKNVKDWKDEKEVSDHLLKILKKEAFGTSGKLYGFGHAVYTLSDPRAVLLKEKARELAKEKDRTDEFELYELIEKVAPKVFAEFKGTSKIISPNVDFYSGFVYDCLRIPMELYTPLFAMARIASWCAHRIEEIISSRKIIRPAYKNVTEGVEYASLDERK
ncbi:citrate/2-methylcitrate synthase [Candidatus Woesearchaeota archaeon]|nr:citrate/2-methylcitrate synthase [Candidatus Woesearchaeota archaeon]